MVLGNENDIARASFAEQRCPLIGMPVFALLVEEIGELIVVGILAISCYMMLAGRGIHDGQRIQVPFGIRIVREPGVPIDFAQFPGRRRPSRNRKQTPVAENSNLAF